MGRECVVVQIEKRLLIGIDNLNENVLLNVRSLKESLKYCQKYKPCLKKSKSSIVLMIDERSYRRHQILSRCGALDEKNVDIHNLLRGIHNFGGDEYSEISVITYDIDKFYVFTVNEISNVEMNKLQLFTHFSLFKSEKYPHIAFGLNTSASSSKALILAIPLRCANIPFGILTVKWSLLSLGDHLESSIDAILSLADSVNNFFVKCHHEEANESTNLTLTSENSLSLTKKCILGILTAYLNTQGLIEINETPDYSEVMVNVMIAFVDAEATVTLENVPLFMTVHSKNEMDEVLVTETRYQLRVLVVEDIITSQRLIKTMLVRLHCVVDIASNGLEALDMMRLSRYDMVLIDFKIPFMNAYELILSQRAFIGSIHPEVAIKPFAPPYFVGMGTKNDLPLIGKCFDVGMKYFLIKPLSMKVLSDVIKDAVYQAAMSHLA